MATVSVEVARMVDAPADKIYAVLSDYKEGHPRILPKEHFRDLEVEKGGRGEGTQYRFKMVSGGRETSMRMRVSEPEPGRVLEEHDLTPGSDMTTRFMLTPAGGGKTRLKITTDWTAPGGLAGLVQRLFYPPALRRIYAKELRRIGEYMASGG
jgi:uncharacterized membrane protein